MSNQPENRAALNPAEELERVKSLVTKLDSTVRNEIKKKIGSDELPSGEIEVMNLTHLHGHCGDPITAVNIKLGDVYYHIYILDEVHDPQVVKVLGPKTTSIEITGFN